MLCSHVVVMLFCCVVVFCACWHVGRLHVVLLCCRCVVLLCCCGVVLLWCWFAVLLFCLRVGMLDG